MVQPQRAPTLVSEMPSTEPRPGQDESLERPVEEVLQALSVHPPYGTDVIEDLSQEEADAFLEAVLS